MIKVNILFLYLIRFSLLTYFFFVTKKLSKKRTAYKLLRTGVLILALSSLTLIFLVLFNLIQTPYCIGIEVLQVIAMFLFLISIVIPT